jgi:regulator of RNase E activity RraA
MNFSKAMEGVSTCDLSDGCDALGIVPVMSGAIKRVWDCGPICGPIVTLKVSPTGNQEIVIGTLKPIMSALPGSILLVDAGGSTEQNTIGSLASMVAAHYRMSGAVVDGCVRDLQGMVALDFPVYARGTVVHSVRGRVGIETINETVNFLGGRVSPGWIAAADMNGTIVFPADRAVEIFKFAHRAVNIERDIFEKIRNGADAVAVHEQLKYTVTMKEQLES